MKTTLNADGTFDISDADEGHENAAAPELGLAKAPAVRTWSLRDAEQLERHLRGLDQAAPAKPPRAKSEDHPWSNLSKGDRSAMADAANESRKQRKS